MGIMFANVIIVDKKKTREPEQKFSFWENHFLEYEKYKSKLRSLNLDSKKALGHTFLKTYDML